MKYGYVRLGAAAPSIKVANCTYNADRIIETIQKAEAEECDLLVFPELSVTGYTCGDLFLQTRLLESARQETLRIAESTKGLSCIAVIGLPVADGANLYNAAALTGKYTESYRNRISQTTVNFMKCVILRRIEKTVRTGSCLLKANGFRSEALYSTVPVLWRDCGSAWKSARIYGCAIRRPAGSQKRAR